MEWGWLVYSEKRRPHWLAVLPAEPGKALESKESSMRKCRLHSQELRHHEVERRDVSEAECDVNMRWVN